MDIEIFQKVYLIIINSLSIMKIFFFEHQLVHDRQHFYGVDFVRICILIGKALSNFIAKLEANEHLDIFKTFLGLLS